MGKNLVIYSLVIAIFGLGIYIILKAGSRLLPDGLPPDPSPDLSQYNSLELQPRQPPSVYRNAGEDLIGKLQQPLSLLLVQIIVIITIARGLGTVFTTMGQPAVIGEMVGGILLGPSLLGWLGPGAEAFLFPVSSLGALQLLGQIGVILFMFIVGMEVNPQSLRQRAHSAVLISHVRILAPFMLGTALSLFLYLPLAPPDVSFLAFALFMGIAMSITAFPVLARIIEQRGLSGSPLGSTAIACAAVDDVTAWCVLAVVVAIARAEDLSGTALTVGLALAFTVVMLFLIKPWLRQIMARAGDRERQSKGMIAGTLSFAFASALFTETIGIHALFGAFVAGAVLPPQEILRVPVKERLETFSTVFLLPLFFAFTGLRTQIGLLDDWQSWLLCGLIVLVAIAGKLGGATLAARWTGMSWRESFSMGALMNTRGLMELIALNIGYDLGILSAEIFAMMVLMALATTFMTGPILSLIETRNQATVLARSDTSATS
jgi:Kef-type K+ transport system membrane component KefB